MLLSPSALSDLSLPKVSVQEKDNPSYFLVVTIHTATGIHLRLPLLVPVEWPLVVP